MSVIAPSSCITFDVVENLIRKCRDDNNLKLISFTVNDAVGKAENFCSNIARISATFFSGSEETQYFIVKSSMEVGDFDTLNDEMSYFPKEILIYDEILPAAAKLLLSIGDSTQIAPRCFAAGEKLNYLIFEDLTSDGFETIDRAKGLDYTHLQLAVSSLAKWHATTAHLLLTQKTLFRRHSKTHYCPESVTVEKFFTNISRTLALVCRWWPGYETISAKLAGISHDAFLQQYRMYPPSDDKFNVLAHGDMWINNFLFKYDAFGHPIGLKIVDFALCLIVSPAYDLCMLLYGSSNESVSLADWDALIQQYQSELEHILKRLRYPKRIPTLSEIHVEIQIRGFHSTLLALYIIGLRNMEAGHDDIFLKFLDESTEAEQYRIDFFSNHKCMNELKYLLKFFDRRGSLDQF